MNRQIETIIWDWNGTMLDDLELCIATINHLLRERNIPELDPIRYKKVFGFPVKDYYERIGFDFSKEPFDIPARQFIDLYEKGMYDCRLHSDVQQILEHLKNIGFCQLVLSAMEKSKLIATLRHNNILDYFDHISGLENHYAHSKLENGKRMLEELNLNPLTTCLIGDTLHDLEVAEAMGIQAFLVTHGHQDEDRLRKSGASVVRDLQEFVAFLS